MHCPLALAHTFKYLARAIGDDDKAEAELFRVALEFLRVVLNVEGTAVGRPGAVLAAGRARPHHPHLPPPLPTAGPSPSSPPAAAGPGLPSVAASPRRRTGQGTPSGAAWRNPILPLAGILLHRRRVAHAAGRGPPAPPPEVRPRRSSRASHTATGGSSAPLKASPPAAVSTSRSPGGAVGRDGQGCLPSPRQLPASRHNLPTRPASPLSLA
nr:uncharacterized protein LOC127303822 [Lolium perenne]